MLEFRNAQPIEPIETVRIQSKGSQERIHVSGILVCHRSRVAGLADGRWIFVSPACLLVAKASCHVSEAQQRPYLPKLREERIQCWRTGRRGSEWWWQRRRREEEKDGNGNSWIEEGTQRVQPNLELYTLWPASEPPTENTNLHNKDSDDNNILSISSMTWNSTVRTASTCHFVTSPGRIN